MMSFNQFINEDGVAAAAPTNSTAGIASSTKEPPVSKRAQKRIQTQGAMGSPTLRKVLGGVNV